MIKPTILQYLLEYSLRLSRFSDNPRELWKNVTRKYTEIADE